MTDSIIAIGVIYFFVTLAHIIGTGSCVGHHYFNPIINYEEWYKLNMFGVLVFTFLINILFAPWAIISWVLKFFAVIFTIGRR